MKEENLSGEQREKTIEKAMRAIWCERGNRIERNRISGKRNKNKPGR